MIHQLVYLLVVAVQGFDFFLDLIFHYFQFGGKVGKRGQLGLVEILQPVEELGILLGNFF